MKIVARQIAMVLPALGLYASALCQRDTAMTSISLQTLDAFHEPPANWVIAGDADASLKKPLDLRPVEGTGVAVNVFSKNNRMHLYTKEEFGDVQLELDFMMAKNSNAGVYLQGRYEIQLLDSWTRLNTGSSDLGAIYSRWTPQRGNFEGTPPLMNVARAPGLWQHLSLKFRAPVFDEKGVKIRHARFEEVYLNGVLIQQAANVTGPTASAMFADERGRGPLVFQGDHGPVAFKNIRYRQLSPAVDSSGMPPGYWYWETRNPILVTPQAKNYLLRSFLEYENKTLTHVISVGSPAELNFAYDMQQGALVKIWRGKFLDVTRMWLGRGEPQLARPLGSVITLGDAPLMAVLGQQTAAWPDSVAFDDMQQHGYVLNRQRMPLFMYSLRGVEIKDSIVFEADGSGITRTVTAAAPPADLFCRLVKGSRIEQVGDDLYAIDGRSFYIRIEKKYGALVRASGKSYEIIVRYDAARPITYSIIW